MMSTYALFEVHAHRLTGRSETNITEEVKRVKLRPTMVWLSSMKQENVRNPGLESVPAEGLW